MSQQEGHADERRWFLDRLRGVILELCSTLQAREFPLPSPNKGTSPLAATLVASSSNNGSSMVKGFVTMDGATIVKGELSIKFSHYNRGNPLKMTINQARPYLLSQITSAYNCLSTCMDILARTTELDSADQDMHYLKDAITDIVTYLVKAREYLETPAESQLFPLKEPDSKCFLPDLPNDLIIEFSAKRTLLAVSIYALSFHQQGIPLHLQSKLLGKFKHFKIGTYQGKEVEIVDEMSIETLSPKLAEAYSSIEHAEALCRDTLTKLIIYNNVL